MKYHVQVDGQQHEVDVIDGGRTRLVVDGVEVEADLKQVNAPLLYSLLMDNRSFELLVEERSDGFAVFLQSELYEVKVLTDRAERLARLHQAGPAAVKGETAIKAPMPGLVVTVAVEPGQQVSKGQSLLILEAMKMENEVRAPQAGTVKAVSVTRGEKVSQGQVLVVME